MKEHSVKIILAKIARGIENMEDNKTIFDYAVAGGCSTEETEIIKKVLKDSYWEANEAKKEMGIFCFRINGKDLYLEKILVNYMGLPIFFICKDDTEYYISLCTNIQNVDYIVAKVPILDIYNLLHQKIIMRDFVQKQTEYWNVSLGENQSLDIVTRHSVTASDEYLLPKDGACFLALTEEMQRFSQKIDMELCKKNRNDYKFSLNELKNEELRKQIIDGNLEDFTPNGDPIRGAAVLEIGDVDIEVNIHAACQVRQNADDDCAPIIDYFCCRKNPEWTSDCYLEELIGEKAALNVHWAADNWEEQLELDMFNKLLLYMDARSIPYNI